MSALPPKADIRLPSRNVRLVPRAAIVTYLSLENPRVRWLNSSSNWEGTMIKASVFYPHKDGSAFDMDYYVNKHIPMVRQKLGSACKGVAVEQGLAGGAPASQPTYAAIGHLLFESIGSFQTAFGPHAATIMADIPNYSTVQPVIQISEVKL